MGVYHSFHLELEERGKRPRNLDWHLTTYDGKVERTEIAGGKSIFGAVMSWFRDNGRTVTSPEELSPELAGESGVDTRSPVFLVPLYLVDPRGEHDHAGFASRTQVDMMRRGEIEEIDDWMEPREFREADSDVRRGYVWHEWDDVDGVMGARRRIHDVASSILLASGMGHRSLDAWVAAYDA